MSLTASAKRLWTWQVCQIRFEQSRRLHGLLRGGAWCKTRSLRVNSSHLAPWLRETSQRRRSSVQCLAGGEHREKFLFMGDRSLCCKSQKELADDLLATNMFDEQTGTKENEKKTQIWRRGQRRSVEHVGVIATTDCPEVEITLAAGWTKVRKVLRRVRGTCGSMMPFQEDVPSGVRKKMSHTSSA